jgi:hypothetical protein
MNRPSTQVEITMPACIALTINTIIIGIIFLFPTISFSSGTDTLLQFLGTEHTPRFSLLPPSLPVAENFKPSTTPYAGTVVQLQGTAYTYHKNGTSVYKLKKDLPVFSGDTLITAENSRITVQMTDETTLILTAQTKLTIKRSLPRIKIRDTVLQLFFGRIRALVKKLAGEYTIKTPTACIGVRGTDFAVAVAPAPKNRRPIWQKKTPTGLLTAVLTGGNQSMVELAGLFGPPITVKPFSAAEVRSGSRAEQAVYIGPAAIPLLQGVAPQHKVLPTVSKSPSLRVDPCWTLSFKIIGTERKGDFEVCKPGQKAPSQGGPDKKSLLSARIKGLPQGFTYKNQKDQGADQDSKGR